VDGNWVKKNTYSVDEIDRIYFTHDGGVGRTEGMQKKGDKNASTYSDTWADVKSKANVKFDIAFNEADDDDNLGDKVNDLDVVKMFGTSYQTECRTSDYVDSGWWGKSEGWEVFQGMDILSTALNRRSTDSSKVHWGLRATSEHNNYLCRIVLTDAMKGEIRRVYREQCKWE
jgi:hypothetical protein